MGNCVLTSIYNVETSRYDLRIDQADPHIWISDEVLHQAHLGPDPALTVRKAREGHGSTGHAVGEHDCWAPAGGFCFYNSIVTLHGLNGTVIYRVGKYDTQRHAWHASWPD